MKFIKKAKIIFNNFFCDRKVLISIICFALFLRIIFFLAVKPYNEQILQSKILANMDARGYHNLALGILQYKSFSSYFGALRTPGYPVFISLIYSIFGIKPWIVLFIQLFLNIGSLIIIYALARIIFNKQIAIISAVLYAIEPHTIFYTVNLMTDTLFVFMFLVSLLFLVYGLKKKRIIFFLISSSLLGLTTLIRPIAQFFPLAVTVIILIYSGIKFSFKSKAIAYFIFVFILTIFPWLYRNYLEYRYFSLSTVKGFHSLRYISFVEASKTNKPKEQTLAEFEKKAEERGFDEEKGNPFDNNYISNKLVTDYIIANWKYYIPRHIKGIINMYLNLDTKAISNFLNLKTSSLPYEFCASPGIFKMVIGFLKVKSTYEIIIGLIIGVFLSVVYLTFFLGSFFIISEKNFFPLILILIIIIYFSALVGVIGLTRFKLPIIPFYLMVSSRGIIEIFGFFRDKKSNK